MATPVAQDAPAKQDRVRELRGAVADVHRHRSARLEHVLSQVDDLTSVAIAMIDRTALSPTEGTKDYFRLARS
jgi:hypothetical protein